jgi:Asp-tRNA(Asn)/Glu-tRNA(Gln) amidotransferase A subunit family amidase
MKAAQGGEHVDHIAGVAPSLDPAVTGDLGQAGGGPRNAEYRRSGRALDAVAYLGSRQWLGMWARRMADWWNDHDLLLTPTLGAPPPELGWFTAAGPEQEKERIISFIPYTPQFNMTGQPAISLPLHWTPAGLPVGVQLAAAYGREDLLIRVASQLEQAAPWSDRYPPVHADWS